MQDHRWAKRIQQVNDIKTADMLIRNGWVIIAITERLLGRGHSETLYVLGHPDENAVADNPHSDILDNLDEIRNRNGLPT